MVSVQDEIKHFLIMNPTVIFTNINCPEADAAYATMCQHTDAKDKIRQCDLGWNFGDFNNDVQDVRWVLGKITGKPGVPYIYINREYIGGNEEIEELKNKGLLGKMLKVDT